MRAGFFNLFTALVVACGFLLGLRVGLALGKRNERKRNERERAARKKRSKS